MTNMRYASESSELHVDSRKKSCSMFLFEWCLFCNIAGNSRIVAPFNKSEICPSQRFNKGNSSVSIIVGIIVNSRVLRSCSRFRRWVYTVQVHLNSVSFPRCFCLGCKLHEIKQIRQIVRNLFCNLSGFWFSLHNVH